MRCLTDVEVQAVVDAEASEASQAHVAACARCHERVTERRREMTALATLMSAEGEVSPGLEARLRHAISTGQPARGATTLRVPPSTSWRRAGWLSAAATAAAVALIVFLILPRFGAPTSLSASEVLGRSLKTLSSTTGVELLEYELFAAGSVSGRHRIEHLIDHERPGRYRFSNHGADGLLESAIGQDPTTGHRIHLIRVDGRNYIIDLATGGGPTLSLPEMGQALVETTITMMQATSDPSLSVLDTPGGRQYVVEMPAVTSSSGAAMFDIYHARAVIDERDFVIQEFEASGALLRQPYSVSFRLIRRSVRPAAEVPAQEFEISVGPTDVVLAGNTGNDPVTDVLTTVLRELGRVKGH